MTLTTEHAEGDGFRVVAAAPREAGRLVAPVRRFYGEIGYEIGPEQAEAIRDLCSDRSPGGHGCCRAGAMMSATPSPTGGTRSTAAGASPCWTTSGLSPACAGAGWRGAC
jgi:hypothetical protein